MNQQDRVLLKEVYGLNYKECNSVFNMVRTGSFTMDSAAKKIIKDKEKK
jgi:hypothetical protein